MADWELVIMISGNSYAALKKAAKECLPDIERTKSFKELDMVNGGHSDSGGTEWGYHCQVKSPVEARIVALRQEADALENDLRAPC